MIGIKQPEESSQTIRVPRRKQCSRNADKIREDRHCDGKEHADYDAAEAQQSPHSPTEYGVRMDVFRMPKESNEYDLGSGVEVNSRSTVEYVFCVTTDKKQRHHAQEEIKERDSKTRLCPLGGQGKKIGRLSSVTDVHIVDDGEHGVKGGRKSL